MHRVPSARRRYRPHQGAWTQAYDFANKRRLHGLSWGDQRLAHGRRVHRRRSPGKSVDVLRRAIERSPLLRLEPEENGWKRAVRRWLGCNRWDSGRTR